LTWQVPTTRANGQALTASELSGYEIYYTTDNPNVSGTFTVSGGTTTTYDANNLAAGTYYFAMSAVDSTGAKSALSTVVTVTFGQ
jgi:hypothetical protein